MGNQVYRSGDGSVMVNATNMAKPFEKRVGDWARAEAAKRHIKILAEKHSLHPSHILKVVNGGIDAGGGTWMHKDLAIEFARWLEVTKKLNLQDVKETYLIFDGRYYKIGESSDSQRRLKSILTSNPSAVLLTYGKGVSEKILHQKYHKHRISGEWFELSKNQASHIIKLIEAKTG